MRKILSAVVVLFLSGVSVSVAEEKYERFYQCEQSYCQPFAEAINNTLRQMSEKSCQIMRAYAGEDFARVIIIKDGFATRVSKDWGKKTARKVRIRPLSEGGIACSREVDGPRAETGRTFKDCKYEILKKLVNEPDPTNKPADSATES